MERILVTGSAGHLGEALVRTLRARHVDVVGVDRLPSAYTTHTGTITDPDFVTQVMTGVQAVLHTPGRTRLHTAGPGPETHRRRARRPPR